jgi:site-specific recombinase XerD
LEKAKNGMDIKAISQSFGHDYVSTTFNIYGNLTPNELRDRLMEIDPTGYEALKGFSPS